MDYLGIILILTTMILFVLKALGIVSTSWLIVFIPLLIYLILFLLVLVALLIFGRKLLINRKINKKDKRLNELLKEYKDLTKG